MKKLLLLLLILSSFVFAEIKVIEEQIFNRGNPILPTNIIKIVEIDNVQYIVVLNSDGGACIIKK
jgi:hypothetical protein